MKSPEFISVTGKGKLFYDDSSLESNFVLGLNPYFIVIVPEGVPLLERLAVAYSKTIRFSGTLDDGRMVKADVLQFRKTQPFEFAALEGICIGQEKNTPPDESRYPLTGYFDGQFALVHNGWDISIIPCKSPETSEAITEKWRCPVDGMVLRLRRKDSTMDQHRDFARVVMNLLSLARGTGVSFYRHFFAWADEELEIWRHMAGDEIGPGPIVPALEMGKFIEQTLPAWETLSQEQQKVLHLALTYINLSGLGYLDTKLFHIVQPWEFLAEAWGMHGEMSDSITCLRSRLKQAVKQWKEEYPDADSDGSWGNRIFLIFKWIKLRDAIERLSTFFGLDLERVGLDLNKLKEARDRVAHSGKLPDQISAADKPALDLLFTVQYCLQLLLLRMLAYQGRVYHASDGVRTIMDIDQALKTARIWRQPKK